MLIIISARAKLSCWFIYFLFSYGTAPSLSWDHPQRFSAFLSNEIIRQFLSCSSARAQSSTRLVKFYTTRLIIIFTAFGSLKVMLVLAASYPSILKHNKRIMIYASFLYISKNIWKASTTSKLGFVLSTLHLLVAMPLVSRQEMIHSTLFCIFLPDYSIQDSLVKGTLQGKYLLRATCKRSEPIQEQVFCFNWKLFCNYKLITSSSSLTSSSSKQKLQKFLRTLDQLPEITNCLRILLKVLFDWQYGWVPSRRQSH